MSPTETVEAGPSGASLADDEAILRSFVKRLAMRRASRDDFVKAAEFYIRVGGFDPDSDESFALAEGLRNQSDEASHARSDVETIILKDIDNIFLRLDRKLAVERDAVDALLARAQRKAG